MKRTRLIAMLVAMTTIATLAADASAYYHPTVGRFISRDPGSGRNSSPPAATAHFPPRDPTGANQYADGMNLYEYVGSRPTTDVDPTGTTIKITCKARVWFPGFLSDLSITGYNPPAKSSDYDEYGGEQTQFRMDSLKSEIVGTMIRSKRNFWIKGDGLGAIVHLTNHINARLNIINAAVTKSFGFKMGQMKMKVNPNVWTQTPIRNGSTGEIMTYKTRPTNPDDTFSAIKDMWINPGQYANACLTGACMVQLRGISTAMGPENFNKIAPELPFNDDWTLDLLYDNRGKGRSVDATDLVPGDFGTVLNPVNVQANQNVIYVGRRLWWGHAEEPPALRLLLEPEGPNGVDTDVKKSWSGQVRKWSWSRPATIDPVRRWPKLGLRDSYPE